ncbi:MAG: chorismate synthase [Victivallales bacterium]|nr:chorismate synthase [Victivallales bacterium]
MSSNWGKIFQIQIFGESHGEAIGVTMDGVPPGEPIDMQELNDFLARRAPGKAPYATARKESDTPQFLSGILDGHTTGAPLVAIIRNHDQHSRDYDTLRRIPRPGHADYPASVRFHGAQDVRGGGHFSGRLTAPLCMAGGVARQILARKGILIGAHIKRLAGIDDRPFEAVTLTAEELLSPAKASFPVLDAGVGETMQAAVASARQEQDSVGGVIECAAIGVPVGWGSPMFGGVENRLASFLFGIPAVRAFEIGDGWAAADARGSVNNDSWTTDGKALHARTNHAGGVLGGITTGMPLIARIAFKPTPSIGREQDSVDLQTMTPAKLTVQGRHDPCIVPRAVPVVEAAFAIVLLDLLLEAKTYEQ